MRVRIFLGVVLLTGCIAQSVDATRIKAKKEESQFVTYKNGPVSFVKSHPFITALIIVTILSSKMRSILIHLPQKLWHDIQRYPVAMALLGGFILSYVLT